MSEVAPESAPENVGVPPVETEEPTHAGFAVQAADTERVLLIQRALDQDDEPDVAGTWEFPGGALEEGESPEAAARREFCEETGLPVPEGEVTGGWRSDNGVYQGYVFTTPTEADAFPELNPDLAAAEMINPDDPERRNPDVSAWFTLQQIQNLGPALRPEVHDTPWDVFAGGDYADPQIPDDEIDPAYDAPVDTEGATMSIDTPEAPVDAVDPDIHDDGDGGMEPEGLEPPVDTGYIPWHGVITVLDTPSGDRRGMTEPRALQRPLPLPYAYQKTSQPGHGGSVVVGRIDQLVKVGQEVRGAGVIFPTPDADEFLGTVAHFPRFGTSVDADDVLMAFDDEHETQWFSGIRVCGSTSVAIPAFHQAWTSLGDAPDGFMDGESLEEEPWDNGDQALVAAAMVAEPLEFKRGPGWVTNPEETRRLWNYWVHGEGARKIGWGKDGDFNRCRVLVGEKIAKNSPEDMRYLNQICSRWHHDALGIWPGQEAGLQPTVVAGIEKFPAVRVVNQIDVEALVASSAAIKARAAWFEDPVFSGADDARMVQDPKTGQWGAPLTITEDGQVFGHIATRGMCHTGIPGTCREAPVSSTNYAYFRLGSVLTDEGLVATGSLTIGCGHADTRLGLQATLAHYDNSGTAWADGVVGDDAFGLWFAGWVRPGVHPEMIVAARASKISGDWRPVAGARDLELVAGLCVNSPGYPVVRIAAGQQTALVAAGVVQGEVLASSVETPGVLDYSQLAARLADEQIKAQRETAALLAGWDD